MEPADALALCLVSAQSLEKDLKERELTEQSPLMRQRIDWMQRQISNLISRLKEIKAELDAGSSFGGLGFGGDEDATDLLEDVTRQIRDMRGMLWSLLLER